LIQGKFFEFVSLSFSCSFCFGFELSLTLLCHFACFLAFCAFCWFCGFFLLLDDLLEPFLAFGLLVVLHCVLDSKFKLCAFYCQWTHQGGDRETNWSVPWFDCDESLTCHGLNSNPGHFSGFILILVHMENHIYLSRGV
jgi:hypothetical protein